MSRRNKNKNNRIENLGDDYNAAEIGRRARGPINNATYVQTYMGYGQYTNKPANSGPIVMPGFEWAGDSSLRGRFTIVLDENVYKEIMYYVRKVDYEVSGWCKVLLEKTNDDEQIIRAISCHLANQEGSTGETTIEAEDLARLDYETMNLPGDLKLWWHSHHTMNAFWSQTDWTNIRDQSAHGWVAAVVFNHKGEARAAVAWGAPTPHAIDNVPMRTEIIPTKEQCETWDANFLKHVRRAGVRTASTTHTQASQNWQRRFDHNSIDTDKRVQAYTGETSGAATSKPAETTTTTTPPADVGVVGHALALMAQQAVEKVSAIAVELGFSVDDSMLYSDLAERLLAEGRYQPGQIVEAMRTRMTERKQELSN